MPFHTVIGLEIFRYSSGNYKQSLTNSAIVVLAEPITGKAGGWA